MNHLTILQVLLGVIVGVIVGVLISGVFKRKPKPEVYIPDCEEHSFTGWGKKDEWTRQAAGAGGYPVRVHTRYTQDRSCIICGLEETRTVKDER